MIADGSTAMDVVPYIAMDLRNQLLDLSLALILWIKSRSTVNDHMLYDTVRGDCKLNSNTFDPEGSENTAQLSFDLSGFTLGERQGKRLEQHLCRRTWDAGTVSYPVGDIWQAGATKYIGVKFASASGGTVSYGQTSGSTTVEVWTSSDNENWTQQGGTLTLSDGHTLTTGDQYVVIRNTTNATFTNWYAAATNGADGHCETYPTSAS